MSSTFETIAGIISEICDLPLEKITPESHVTEDLGVDSLAFLDAVFTIDQRFGIKIPLEEWTAEVNEGKVRGSHYFLLKNFCAEIDKLIAANAGTAAAG
ncbi:MAG: acyl carrier protein [Hyphomicrobiales bacterium]|jgi:acyl carrier protein|nr:acyl carrier protein [Hyphomicrobiales bacterium]